VVGTQHVSYQRVHIFGSTGHIEVQIPFNAPHDRPCNVYVDDGSLGSADFTVQQTSEQRAERLAPPAANHYTLQFQAFSEAIRRRKPVLNDLPSAIANLRVIDAIFRAAESQRWERV
jgi:predicted dehydrogenase